MILVMRMGFLGREGGNCEFDDENGNEMGVFEAFGFGVDLGSCIAYENEYILHDQ